MGVTIQDIAYYLPRNVLKNEELARKYPNWDVKQLEERVGVATRHIAKDNETALDLALGACKKLFKKNKALRKKIDCLIFCTQSEDYIMPPNSALLHKELNLPERVAAFDFNLACSGYVYGLALSQGLIAAGIASNILLVTADTYSKYINKKDRATRTLFGDAAAVSFINESKTSKGIVDIILATSGKGYDKFIIPAGGLRIPKSKKTKVSKKDKSGNIHTLENIHMDGRWILAFVNSQVPKQVLQILRRNNLKIDNIDLFIFHQASKIALESLARNLRINPDKVFSNLKDVGNTVSSSIPIALKDAWSSGRVSRGDKVLLCGFGVGLSWATAIYEI